MRPWQMQESPEWLAVWRKVLNYADMLDCYMAEWECLISSNHGNFLAAVEKNLFNAFDEICLIRFKSLGSVEDNKLLNKICIQIQEH